jgi:hypothetical protein
MLSATNYSEGSFGRSLESELLLFKPGMRGISAVFRRHFLVTTSQVKASHFCLLPSTLHLVQRIPPALAVLQSYPSLLKTLTEALLKLSAIPAYLKAEPESGAIALRDTKPMAAINREGIFIDFII